MGPTLNLGFKFETKLNLIAKIFLKLLIPKDVVIEMHKRSCFRKSFGCEHVNVSQKPVKSAQKHFCIFHVTSQNEVGKIFFSHI